jgi:hypothetical protein
MMTGADVALSADGRTAWLSQSGRKLRAEVLEPAAGRFQVRSANPPTTAENPNAADSILSLEAPPGRALGDLRLAVLFTPAGDSWPQRALPEVTGIANWR